MKKTDFTTIGASAHSKGKRAENDFYATDPKALEIFLDETDFHLNNVWECACGQGHLAKVLRKKGVLGKASDLIDRGYGQTDVDFFKVKDTWDGDILTNPPYSDALRFCEHSLSLITEGSHVLMLMRVQFLEGQKRKPFFKENPPKYVFVSSSRLTIAKNGDFVKYKAGSANCYAWFVWQKGYKGQTIVKWFN